MYPYVPFPEAFKTRLEHSMIHSMIWCNCFRIQECYLTQVITEYSVFRNFKVYYYHNNKLKSELLKLQLSTQI